MLAAFKDQKVGGSLVAVGQLYESLVLETIQSISIDSLNGKRVDTESEFSIDFENFNTEFYDISSTDLNIFKISDKAALNDKEKKNLLCIPNQPNAPAVNAKLRRGRLFFFLQKTISLLKLNSFLLRFLMDWI